MIIWNDTIAMGDCLNTFPLMVCIMRQAKEPVEIYWSNAEVGDLFCCEDIEWSRLDKLPTSNVIKISMHDFIWGRTGWHSKPMLDGHFSKALLEHYGFEATPQHIDVPVKISEDSDIPSYDFVIAPYVLNNASKNMSPAFWQELVNNLKNKYLGCSICVIGKSSLPSDEDLLKIEADIGRWKNNQYAKENLTQYLTGVDYFWDQSLLRVAGLLNNVKKCFISVDSGPSHLNARLRKPHIELFHWCILSRHVQNHPGHEIRHGVNRVTIDAVMNDIDNLLRIEGKI